VVKADMKCSMTTSVLPGRVGCHHPRDRFTRVKTTAFYSALTFSRTTATACPEPIQTPITP
jgi:hypothetical protein